MLRLALLLLAGLVAGCSQPTAPRQSDAPQPAPATASLFGTVVDIAGRPIPGALVENVDGQGAAASTVTNETGRYELQVPVSGSVTVRVSKEGYSSLVSAVNLPRPSATDFDLRFLGPSVDLRGAFTMTFTADAAACTQLPPFMRTRTYSASMSQVGLPNDYWGTLSGASFHYREFAASVAGRFASFFTLADGYEAVIAERLDSPLLVVDVTVAGWASRSSDMARLIVIASGR